MSDQGPAEMPDVGRRRLRQPGAPLWFVLVFSGFGLAAVLAGLAGAGDELRYRDQGVSLAAQVIDMRFTRGGPDESDTYEIRYEFRDVATGSVHGDFSAVDRAQFLQVEVGGQILITYLPSDPATSRVGSSEPQLGLPLVAIGAGSLFVFVGVVLVFTTRRARRMAELGLTGATPRIERSPVQHPGLTGELAQVEAFTRSPARVIVDLVGAPIGGLAFLGMAFYCLSQLATTPGLLIGVLVGGFFGIMLLSGSWATLRRGTGRALVRVGPDGMWLRDVGLLAWSEIAEVRIEHNIGAGGDSLTRMDRVGVIPRDASRVAAVPGGLARRLAGAFIRFANERARERGARHKMTDLDRVSPIGVYGFEIEQPFDVLLASIRRFAPVGERADALPAAPPSSAVMPDLVPAVPLSADALRDLDRRLAPGAEPVAPARADGGSLAGLVVRPATVAVASGLASPDGERTFLRGDRSDDVRWAMSIMFCLVPLLFFAGGIAALSDGQVGTALMIVSMPAAFFVAGVYELLGIVGRRELLAGDPAILTVGLDGISMRTMGRLRWTQVEDVTADGSELRIRPSESWRLAERHWAIRVRERAMARARRLLPFVRGTTLLPAFTLDMELLEADRDEILDAIARYRVVNEI